MQSGVAGAKAARSVGLPWETERGRARAAQEGGRNCKGREERQARAGTHGEKRESSSIRPTSPTNMRQACPVSSCRRVVVSSCSAAAAAAAASKGASESASETRAKARGGASSLIGSHTERDRHDDTIKAGTSLRCRQPSSRASTPPIPEPHPHS
jgi:hypothetical protein